MTYELQVEFTTHSQEKTKDAVENNFTFLVLRSGRPNGINISPTKQFYKANRKKLSRKHNIRYVEDSAIEERPR